MNNQTKLQTTALPHSVDSEKGVLSCLMIEPQLLNDCTLLPEMFFLEKHRTTFEAFVKLADFNLVSLYEELKTKDVTYTDLAELQTFVPSSSHLNHYQEIVKNKWRSRKMIEIGDEIIGIGYREKAVDKAVKIASKLDELTEFHEEITEPIDEISTKPFTYGTYGLDQKITPIEKHAMVVIAGETGTGKTAFTFFMAKANALEGHRTMYISLEMDTNSIITRVARDYAGITKGEWREKDKIPTDKVSAYRRKKEEIKATKNLIPFGFSQGQSTSIESILRAIDKEKPDLAFIDNIGCIDKAGLNHFEAEGNISQKTRDFCKHKKIPIVLLHHYKKGDGKGKMRSLDDLKGNSVISFDANVVIQLWRKIEQEGESLTEQEKKALLVIQMKDREFGVGGSEIVYFNKGDFRDGTPEHKLIENATKVFKS